ncbi:MAG: hypothetical protein WC069_02535 [Candidatus Shapirobacteria bacterium]
MIKAKEIAKEEVNNDQISFEEQLKNALGKDVNLKRTINIEVDTPSLVQTAVQKIQAPQSK